ncbi:hypothetical protein F5Y03DRAFT_350017 [Xylaria venustula]|nr:hypothetical protein F5Y03DRAFT_350017 [Xylaria venustula]
MVSRGFKMRSTIHALGVMSSVIQLIELGQRLLSEVRYIYHDQLIDQQDASSMRTDIDIIHNHLLALRVSIDGNEMTHIILQCIESGENLSAALWQLAVADHSERMQLTCSISAGLLRLQQQVSILVLRWIHEQYFEFRESVRCASIACGNPSPLPHSPTWQTSCFPPSGELRQPYGSAFLHLLTSNIPASAREESEKNMKNHILTEIYNGQGQLSPCTRLHDLAWEKNIQRSFLWRLRDPDIDYQNAKDCGSRGNLYNWLFESSSDRDGNGTSFRDWAFNSPSSQPTFWITGKPGAGKTILAEVIFERLSRQNVALSYFFVGDTKSTRKGVRGFLQSILWQLLSKDPETIPIIAPCRWEALVLFGEDPKPFDTAELEQMLVSTLHQRPEASRIFILIDALDQYQGIGDGFEIIELLHKIIACPGVKVCISSRPLPHIQNFMNGAPGLVLEDCNSQDMEEFVTSKIEAHYAVTHDSIIGLVVKEQLIHEVTTRAEGCFLWVVLVIESLQKLLARRDDDEELLCFVKKVPMGLTELFRCVLSELDTSKPFIACSLRFIATFDEPVSPLRLSLMEMDFPDFALRQEISPLSREHLDIRRQESLQSYMSRSGGLLGVVETLKKDDFQTCEGGCRVSLIHRTLKEYICKNTGSQPISGLGDFAVRYSAASLLILKINPIGESTIQSVAAEAIRCTRTAILAQTENEVYISRLLDELEQTCYVLLETIKLMPGPWIGSESNDLAYYSMLIEERFLDHGYPWLYDLQMGCEKATKIRRRAMALCAKYDMVRWIHLQNSRYRRPDPPCQSCERMYHRWPPCLWDIANDFSSLHGGGNEQEQNSSAPLEEIGLVNTERDEESSTKQDVEGNGAIHKNNQREDNCPSDDNSDNMSWESWSSSEVSLHDAHPLMALKDEATEAVFQGFMEYRKRHIEGGTGTV